MARGACDRGCGWSTHDRANVVGSEVVGSAEGFSDMNGDRGVGSEVVGSSAVLAVGLMVGCEVGWPVEEVVGLAVGSAVGLAVGTLVDMMSLIYQLYRSSLVITKVMIYFVEGRVVIR